MEKFNTISDLNNLSSQNLLKNKSYKKLNNKSKQEKKKSS